jgi:hypothetical protein
MSDEINPGANGAAGGAAAGGDAAGGNGGAGNGAAEPQGRAADRYQQYQVERNAREAAAEAPDNRQQQQKPAGRQGGDSDRKVSFGGVELTADEARALVARDAAARSKELSRPQSPDGYRAEPPSDFKPPDGLNFQFNAADPLLHQARAVAHAEGLSQEGFSRLLAIYAGSKVGEAQTINNARNAEIQKLGANGPSRFMAVETFLKGKLGEAGGAQIAARICTASDVEQFEKLVATFTSQGGASFSQRGREAPDQPGRASDEQVARMTPAERLNYSRMWDQRTMPAWDPSRIR